MQSKFEVDSPVGKILRSFWNHCLISVLNNTAISLFGIDSFPRWIPISSIKSVNFKYPENNKKAHKFLAFIYCASERRALCENEFKQAFDIDPGFTLSPAESGHPMWQPAYDMVKSRIAPVKKTP